MNKLEVLKLIAKRLNDNNIPWALGASAMLYFRGIVNEFHDFDIMFDLSYENQIKDILKDIAILETRKENSDTFKTKAFLEYKIDDVEIDLMGGFIIHSNGIDYDCSLKKEYIDTHILLENIDIPLYSLNEWKRFYALMNRENKVKIIEDYLKTAC